MVLKYDPLQPVYPAESTPYVAPTLAKPIENLGETKNASSYLNPETDTVEGRVGNILSSGGLLNQKTQQTALDIGNSRGLLNSRGTAQAGTSALIDKAVGIATPDAETYSSFGKTNQNTENQGLLNNQTASLQQQQSEANAKLEGALKDQTYGNTANLSNQEYKQTAGLADKTAENQIKVNEATQQLQADIAKNYKEFSYTFDKALVELGIEGAERQSAATAISNQTQTLMGIMGSFINNTDLNITENTPTWVSDWMYKGWETTASLYGLDIKVT